MNLQDVYRTVQFPSVAVYRLNRKLNPILASGVEEVRGATASWGTSSHWIGRLGARATTVGALALLPVLSVTPFAVAPLGLLLFGSGAPVSDTTSRIAPLRAFDLLHQYGVLGLGEWGLVKASGVCERSNFVAGYQGAMLGAILLAAVAQLVRFPVSLGASIANIVGALVQVLGNVIGAATHYATSRIL